MFHLREKRDQIQSLDVESFRRAFRVGVRRVLENLHKLNEINVFPVADGDTGTNLSLTLQGALKRIRGRYNTVGSLAKNLSEALLIEAKGNSGVILSQFFLGVAESIGERVRVSAKELGEAFRNAVGVTYRAVENPQEGTILTVMGAAAEGMEKGVEESKGVINAVENAIKKAKKALENTPELLPVLKEKGVVDAGGFGFTLLLEGFLEGLKVKTDEEAEFPTIPNLLSPGHQDARDSIYRYCTEGILRGEELSPQAIKGSLRGFGDSLLVAGTNQLVHIHIHTDRPEEVFDNLLSFGTLDARKVDMMKPPCTKSPGEVAVITDATCDLPPEIIEEKGICVVPLNVIIGDQSFKDSVEISRREIINLLRSGSLSITTSQPSLEDYVCFYRSALEHAREVIIISLSGGLSGTYRSAEAARRLFDPEKILVFDSKTASLGEGLLAMRAAELSGRGLSLVEIVEQLERLKEKLVFYFTFKDFRFIVRSGRISWSQGRLARLLNMRPILVLADGKEIKRVSKAFGFRNLVKKLIKRLRRDLVEGGLYDVGVAHAMVPEVSDLIRERLQEFIRIRYFISRLVTPVLSVHAGPGAWGVFALPVEEPQELGSGLHY